MNNIISEISDNGIMPMIALDNPQKAAELIKSLTSAGVYCAAFDFSSSAEAVKNIAANFPDFLAGAYNIATDSDAKEAEAAGAKFIIADNFAQDTVNIPVLKILKADIAVKSNEICIGDIGNDIKNINACLKHKNVIACAVKDIALGQIDEVCKEAVDLMLGYGLKHVGINSADEAEASKTADAFQALFGFKKQDFGGAYFNADLIEVMKKPFYGKNGHIGISTDNVQRAAYRFRKAGIAFNEASAGYNEDGSLRVIYFKDEIGGFAVHIVQK